MGPFIPNKHKPAVRSAGAFRPGDRVRVRPGEHLVYMTHIVDDQLPGDIYSHEGTVVSRHSHELTHVNWDNGPSLVYNTECIEHVGGN